MEYISDGFSLCHVPAEECPVALSASHGLGQARLWSLGRVLAMDMLVNNFDRFPLVWDNEGNAGNVMLTPLDDVGVVPPLGHHRRQVHATSHAPVVH